MYSYDQRPGTGFTDQARRLLDEIKAAEYAVLVGRNDCGKSFILKSLAEELGQGSSYLGPARHQNFNVLNSFAPTSDTKANRHRDFLQMWKQRQQNIDNSPLNLQQAVAELTDSAREDLIRIVKLLLDTDMQIQYTVPHNSMSQQYISVNGHNISFSSSGFRLIATLVTCLLNPEYDTFLIDEPELGISPEAQGVVADFLFDRRHRAKYFPHIKTIVLATHSSVFLDRGAIANNYIVNKTGDLIDIRRAATLSEFHRIHFFLLGNRFETLYLPSAILLVEGKTDQAFIARALSCRFPTHQLSVIKANSDSRIKEILNVAKGLLIDLQKSPYHDRIFVVLDSVHNRGLQATLVGMGLPQESIVVWSSNGIEHVYPPTILDTIFGAGESITISDDMVSRNSISYSKAELSDLVCAQLSESTPMHPEFDERLVRAIEERIA